jgi:hypothetical protein
MSSDLIAWAVAVTLGVVVVVLGLRRNLSATTRSWLPRFGEGSGEATVPPRPFGAEQRRRPVSPRERRWLVAVYQLISLFNAARALLEADDRLFHATFAALFALAAMAFLLKKWPPSADRSIS